LRSDQSPHPIRHDSPTAEFGNKLRIVLAHRADAERGQRVDTAFSLLGPSGNSLFFLLQKR
jgi:hypothetical protein